ncbi:putative transporter [Colletotrichum sp. SAR 10_96]|nr:putative transporter [Colletotrichum sp. SAR 10_96]
MPSTMNPNERPEPQQQTTASTDEINESKPSAAQLETMEEASLQNFKLSKSGGDVALALFDNVGGIHDPIDPEEDRKLVRKGESMWYTRREQPIKIGLWYTANGIGIALGGLLGYGIGNIKGALASWKYEFIIVGALCCAWGIVIAVFLPDNPITNKALSQREKKIVIERLRENQTGVENKTLKLYQVREAFTDFKLYFFFMIALLQAIVNGGTSNFGTLIIKGFNFSTLITAVLQVPYGVLIFIAILVCVFINDRLPPNNRCFMLVLFLLPNVVGAFGLRFVPDDQQVGRLICYYVSSYHSSMSSGVSRGKKLIVIFQLTGSINASFVLLLSLQTANIAGHTKKVVTSACLFLGYCVGNIAGPFFYKSDQAPKYELGIWSMIVAHLLEVVIVIALRFLLKWENERRDRAQGEVAEVDLDATAFGDLTDQENMNFRYIY